MSKIIKKLTLLIILITLAFGISTISNAANDVITTKTDATKVYGTTMPNLPQNNTAGATGMMPQYRYSSSSRKVTLPDTRLNLETNEWEALINGQIVYCARRGSYVRYGKYDSNSHLLIPGQTTIQGVPLDIDDTNTIENLVEGKLEESGIVNGVINNMKNFGFQYWKDGELVSSDSSVTVKIEYKEKITGNDMNPKALGIVATGGSEQEWAQNGTWDLNLLMSEQMKEIMVQLGHAVWPGRYSADVDGNSDSGENTISAKYGPKIVVMETAQNASNGYGNSPAYSSRYQNDKKAFILTALENAYSYENGKLAEEYTLNDIQSAYWWALHYENGHNRPTGGKSTPKGEVLYQKAVEYADFMSRTNGNYDVSINQNDAKVMVNYEKQCYYVGPFTITYPQYEDISYVKALKIMADNETLTYGLGKNDFEVITETGGIKSNGLSQVFPKSGEAFFIKFDAAKISNKSKIKLGVNFEYLNGTTLNYDMLQTTANIYQYIGYTGVYVPGSGNNSEYMAIEGRATVYVKYITAQSTEKTHKIAPHQYGYKDDFSCCDGGEYKNKENNDPTLHDPRGFGYTANYVIYQPYIKMTEDPVETALAQDLIIAKDGKRIYKTKYIETSLIDLTIELGGKVWEDQKSGKEYVENGKYDNEESRNLIPNVVVTLYDEKHQVVGTTKTDEFGEYRFKNLNAMYKYYVKFTYNGQYYQPTYYTSPDDTDNGWGSINWENNSNATDKRAERLEFNNKFETIQSTPNNYRRPDGTYNKTYTKDELLILNADGSVAENSIIDLYGNLINPNGDRSKVNYVKDCLMNAYTGKDIVTSNTYEYDLYPTPDIFIKEAQISSIVRGKFQMLDGRLVEISPSDITMLYPDAYYINLGLAKREEADMAVKKDISEVTLEINGQKHKYDYNTLSAEGNITAEGDWEIEKRLSDGYYDKTYTREIYKSDYLYKASSYGAKANELGKSQADELEVYVTYRIMVKNQSNNIRIRPNEIVDYYDEKDYEYVDERSYIEIIKDQNTSMKYKVKASDRTIYPNTETTITGYKTLYVQGLYKNAQAIDNTGKNIGNPIAEGVYLEAGEIADIFLTFKVKKEVKDGEKWVILDEEVLTGEAIGVGKENIAELNGYSTQYQKGANVPNVLDKNGNLVDLEGTPAGLVDIDSNPGNLKPVDVPKDGKPKFENFEDDTDKSPNLHLILYRGGDRIISGSVWEDERTKLLSTKEATIGDGKKSDNETLINGVTVQLVEIMENGKEFIWRETSTGTKSSETPIINNKDGLVKDYEFGENKDGNYAFKSFIPGKYVVRFIYGDTVKTVAPEDLTINGKKLGGLNKKSYNGQDFKSTTYQQGVNQNKVYTWREPSTWTSGQETLGKVLTFVSTFKSDASNNETLNLAANQNDNWLNNKYAYLYDIEATDRVTDSVSDAKDIESRREQVVNYSTNNVTNYISEVLASHKSDYTTMNDRNQLLNDLMNNTKMTAETGLMVIELEKAKEESDGTKEDNKYHISNVDLGLEERPKAQIIMNKEVTNVKLTLADGSILFDAKNTEPNVLWKDHKEYLAGYKGGLMDPNKFGSISKIREANSNKIGLIQLSMDEELMHGATIKISYKITVTNVGEVDYIDNLYYYTGVKSPNAKVVTTRVDKVLDYVANNLQFYAKDNPNWKVIKVDDIKSQGLVNSNLHQEVEKFNTIIETPDLARNLVPKKYKDVIDKNAQDSISVPLVLTQLITTENDGDDLTYKNIVEVVQISNTAGRRQEFSVVGNQNPNTTKSVQELELDSDISEEVKILPPFGNAGIYIIIAIITILTATIFTGGVIFIKKKVLKK